MTIRKLFLALSIISIVNANDDDDDFACCPDEPADQLCYLGSLDLKLKDPETQQLSLCYDGTIVTVNDGVYCFKENKDVEKIYVLFMDADAIRSIKKSTEGNTIGHLSFTPQTSYHFYRLKRIPENDATYNWQIKRKSMPKREIQGHFVACIPDHTLIIPLDSQFFKKTERNSIMFTYQALKNNANVIKLPAPITDTSNKPELKDALIRAKMCIIHLKTIHAKQETREVYLDKHRLIQ